MVSSSHYFFLLQYLHPLLSSHLICFSLHYLQIHHHHSWFNCYLFLILSLLLLDDNLDHYWSSCKQLYLLLFLCKFSRFRHLFLSNPCNVEHLGGFLIRLCKEGLLQNLQILVMIRQRLLFHGHKGKKLEEILSFRCLLGGRIPRRVDKSIYV